MTRPTDNLPDARDLARRAQAASERQARDGKPALAARLLALAQWLRRPTSHQHIGAPYAAVQRRTARPYLRPLRRAGRRLAGRHLVLRAVRNIASTRRPPAHAGTALDTRSREDQP